MVKDSTGAGIDVEMSYTAVKCRSLSHYPSGFRDLKISRKKYAILARAFIE